MIKSSKGYSIPIVIEKGPNGESSYDIYSRLLKDRVVFLGDEIQENTASNIIAQFLYLNMQSSSEDIKFYIMSYGGCVDSTLAIYDTMQHVSCDIATYCIGHAMSGGSVLLCAGTKGKRYILPHSTVMIHQPWGGVTGDATDIEIASNEINKKKHVFYEIYKNHTKMRMEEIKKKLERDVFFTAEESLKKGLVDKILSRSQKVKK
jgi:ATP-dependent Clp protease protease subunit